MFTKIVSTVSVLLAVSAHVNGHTLMTPALGVQGAGARSDVQRLAKTGGCGNMDVASNIDTSTPVAAAADGTFTVTATNFNRLTDGSRQLTATMDSTGTGNNFNGAVTVTQNGDNRPKSLGSEQIVAAIPAGTTCTGGASGNLCLVSFQNGARQGFGNCVVVSQGAAAGTGAAAAGTGAATGSTATAANAGTGASDTSAVGAATGSTGAEAGTGTAASDTSAVGAATGSTGVEAGAGTGASDTSAVGAATGSTGVEAGAGTGASDNSAVGASTGSAATSGTGAISAGNTAGTGVGAGVNGVASGAGVATSGSTTASTGQAISQAGSRAARALLAELEARGEDSLDLVRRGIVDWIWA